MLKTKIRGWLLRLILPKGARITFSPSEFPPPTDHFYDEPPENMDPEFLFGRQSGPVIGINRIFLSFNSREDCPAGAEFRKESAKRTAQDSIALYGDITERRDVFFEDVEWNNGTAVFPISAVQ